MSDIICDSISREELKEEIKSLRVTITGEHTFEDGVEAMRASVLLIIDEAPDSVVTGQLYFNWILFDEFVMSLRYYEFIKFN